VRLALEQHVPTDPNKIFSSLLMSQVVALRSSRHGTLPSLPIALP
jgi:hypothetical protein